jgi:hypothetical protein
MMAIARVDFAASYDLGLWRDLLRRFQVYGMVRCRAFQILDSMIMRTYTESSPDDYESIGKPDGINGGRR